MNRIQYNNYGGPEVMRLEDYHLPGPEKGEILVKIKAASVNPVDWKIRNGVMKLMTGRKFPRAMGSDFSGVVEAVGAGVTRLKVGDEVLGVSRMMKESGSFAETMITNEKFVVQKPENLSFEEAACLPLVATTAWIALVTKADIKPGQNVFINGCMGGIGRMAVQIAVTRGAKVTGACAASDKNNAKALGVNQVIDYKNAKLSSLSSQFDIVFDTAGTLSMQQAMQLLRPGSGVFLDPNTTGKKMMQGIFNRRYKMVMAKVDVDVLTRVADAVAKGKLNPFIGKTIPLSGAVTAITELEKTGQPKGKLVIKMS